MLWNKQHSFISCSQKSAASPGDFTFIQDSRRFPSRHISTSTCFVVIMARGAKDRESSPSNENLGTQVTHATLAPIALVNTGHVAVPSHRK